MAYTYLHPLLRVFGSVVALILLLICLFAGSSPKFLPDAEIFRVDLSQLPTTQDGPNIVNVYLMSYCVGLEQQFIDADNTTTTKTTMSKCSDRSVSFHFKPFEAIREATGIQEPGDDQSFSTSIDALAPASRAMTVFFILGASFVIVSIMIRIAAHHFRRRFARYRIPDSKTQPLPGHPDYSIRGNLETPPSYLELFSLMLSTMCLLIASIITSVVAAKFVSLLRTDDFDVSARHNNTFLGMAWSATVIQAFLTIHKVASLVRYESQYSLKDSDEYSLNRGIDNRALFSRIK
ncbi:hypothetical protein N7490_011823 [Penicillium lividum]|nr:hypothetical protein N7490_011823 [Penicillium lividum]